MLFVCTGSFESSKVGASGSVSGLFIALMRIVYGFGLSAGSWNETNPPMRNFLAIVGSVCFFSHKLCTSAVIEMRSCACLCRVATAALAASVSAAVMY